MATLQAAPGSRVANFFHFRRDPLDFLLGVREVGDIVALSSARAKPSYVVNDPECIRDVLVTQESAFVKGRSSRILGETLGDGLLTSEGTTHLHDRRMMSPAFHLQQVKRHVDTIAELAGEETERWGAACANGQRERLITQDLMELTLRIIMRTMFADQRLGQENRVGAAVDECVRYSARKLYAPISLPVRIPTPGQLSFRKALAQLNGYLDECMEEAFKAVDASSDEPGSGHVLDMLIRHLAAGDQWPENRKKVRDELITILIAGHETTANALSWALYLLAANPAVQSRLYDEVAQVLSGQRPTMADLQALSYTQQVVQETLRLYPTAWLLLREARVTVEIAGHAFPRDAVFLMSPYAVQRAPEWFHEPLSFMPERFAGGVPQGLPRYAYFPFGGGARSCIGQQFALLEATVILATLTQSFWFSLCEESQVVRPEPSVSLRIAGGLRLQVTPRT